MTFHRRVATHARGSVMAEYAVVTVTVTVPLLMLMSMVSAQLSANLEWGMQFMEMSY